MDYAIPIDQLAWFLLFLIAVSAGVYLILTLRNLNGLIRDVGAALEKNREPVDRAMTDLPRITENAVAVSEKMRTQVAEMGLSLDQVSDSVTDTAETVNQTVEQFSTYAILFSEVVKLVVDLVSRSGRKR